jgi:WD repeat-containing protein 68
LYRRRAQSYSQVPIYAIDWARTPGTGPFAHLPRSSYRLALGSFTDDFRNRISIVGLSDERPLQENNSMDDPYGNPHAPTSADESNFVLLADALHGYPVTKIAWEPANSYREAWKDHSTELLTSTGDALRIWEFSQVEEKPNAFIGRHTGGTTGKLAQKFALSSVRVLILILDRPRCTDRAYPGFVT